MNYIIRKIKPEDAQACYDNQHANHFHDFLWSLDSWKFVSTFLKDSWVAEFEGKVIAHNVGLIVNLDNNQISYNILDNCVNPDYRMSGVSGTIMDNMCQFYPMMNTNIHADNKAAEHILVSRGFRVIEEVENHFSDGGTMKYLIRSEEWQSG